MRKKRISKSLSAVSPRDEAGDVKDRKRGGDFASGLEMFAEPDESVIRNCGASSIHRDLGVRSVRDGIKKSSRSKFV